jgi:hypothetical protein
MKMISTLSAAILVVASGWAFAAEEGSSVMTEAQVQRQIEAIERLEAEAAAGDDNSQKRISGGGGVEPPN